MMRARAAIENVTKEKQAIIVTEIPYQVNKARLIERIADLVNDKTIDDISDIRDESDRDGMRIVIELKRGCRTADRAQSTVSSTRRCRKASAMILLAVVNQQPKEMGLIQAIQHFINHRVDVVRRRTAYLLSKARDREHILEGYLTALDHLDNVITIIRGEREPRGCAGKFGRVFRRQKDRHQYHRAGAETARGEAVSPPNRRMRFLNCNCIA